MNPALAVKLRPAGPWRIGPDSGARNRVDAVYHSDSLYSAVTGAMLRLGSLDEWLAATARDSANPAVRFSSCFPFLDEHDYVIPPRTVWPPQAAASGARVRWKSARFVPLSVVRALLAGSLPDDHKWSVDGTSECLVPAGSQGPFRTSVRSSAAVDRLTGSSERHSTACLEFRPGAGLWTIVWFASEAARDRWAGPVKAAFRLLADSGFGGERSRGWGRAGQPEFVEGSLPAMILPAEESVGQAVSPVQTTSETPAPEAAPVEAMPPPEVTESAPAEATPEPVAEAVVEAPAATAPVASNSKRAHWLLSLYSPAASDTVDWTRGNYALVARGGRVDSPAASGALKKQLNMVTEGSVLVAGEPPCGAAPDVAPEGFPHPVFRAGFALAIALPGEVS